MVLNPLYFRPSTHSSPKHVNFVLHSGGIGDYTAYLSSLLWIAKAHPQVHGTIHSPTHFIEIPQFLFKNFPNWKIVPRGVSPPTDNPTFEPHFIPANCLGTHPLDLGFIYFAGQNPPPDDFNFYPTLDFAESERPLPSQYAVLIPGGTHPNRTLPPKAFNGIKEYLLSLNLIPVFLGKTDTTPAHRINYPDGYDYTNAVNLIDKTTLLEAAKIMAFARVVIGLDNGLLHLAATTDVPVVFGYTIAAPKHRNPRRKQGITYNIHPDPQTLPCTFCQSNMRFINSHDFAHCVYHDLKCIDELSDPTPWLQLTLQAIAEDPRYENETRALR